HHFGGRTFVGSGIDFKQLMMENEQKYREKWQPQLPVIPPANQPDYTITEAAGGGLLLEQAAPRLSLCMIVRDNESTIRGCLESIRPWVEEMIVVDTGSLDATLQICQEFGARVFHWAWRDDFSAARNESLKYARGKWIFWMDSDDTIPAECGRKLRALAEA